MSKTVRWMWRHALAIAAAGAIVGLLVTSSGGTALADYGSGAQYQVEISSNPGGVGFWLWSELGPGQSSDYQETDCIHLGGGHATDAAAHDAGSLSGWSVSNGTLTMNGMQIIGGAALANISVPDLGPDGYGKVSSMTLTVTWEAEPFFPLNVPIPFPAMGVVAP
jgi:hypothetical protein